MKGILGYSGEKKGMSKWVENLENKKEAFMNLGGMSAAGSFNKQFKDVSPRENVRNLTLSFSALKFRDYFENTCWLQLHL